MVLSTDNTKRLKGCRPETIRVLVVREGSEGSGLDQIEQLATLIHQPVAQAAAAGTGGGGAIGIALVVLLLEAMPVAELVLPLDDDAGHGVLDGLTEISVRGAEGTGVSLVRMTDPEIGDRPAWAPCGLLR